MKVDRYMAKEFDATKIVLTIEHWYVRVMVTIIALGVVYLIAIVPMELRDDLTNIGNVDQQISELSEDVTSVARIIATSQAASHAAIEQSLYFHQSNLESTIRRYCGDS